MLATYTMLAPLGNPVASRRPYPMTFHRAQRGPSPVAPPRSLGQSEVGVIKAAAAAMLVGNLALSAGGAWVGFHTGAKERGFLSFTGYAVGAVSALGGLFSLLSLAGLAFLPSPNPGPETQLTPAA